MLTDKAVQDEPPVVDTRISPFFVVRISPTATTVEELDHAADSTTLEENALPETAGSLTVDHVLATIEVNPVGKLVG